MLVEGGLHGRLAGRGRGKGRRGGEEGEGWGGERRWRQAEREQGWEEGGGGGEQGREGEGGGEEEVRDLGLGLREGFFENCAGVGFVKKQQYRIFSSSCSNKI